MTQGLMMYLSLSTLTNSPKQIYIFNGNSYEMKRDAKEKYKNKDKHVYKIASFVSFSSFTHIFVFAVPTVYLFPLLSLLDSLTADLTGSYSSCVLKSSKIREMIQRSGPVSSNGAGQGFMCSFCIVLMLSTIIQLYICCLIDPLAHLFIN